MPRYFFNLRYGSGSDDLAVDPEGDELINEAAVQPHALQIASDLVAGPRSVAVRDWFACSLEIKDENGHHVLTVPFSDTAAEDDGQKKTLAGWAKSQWLFLVQGVQMRRGIK